MLKAISELVVKLPWSMIILFCLTLGFAPFFPIPHMWEKINYPAAEQRGINHSNNVSCCFTNAL